MEEIELIATFDTDETAKQVAKTLNAWFSWIMENNQNEEIPNIFDDFGISSEEYFISKDEANWEDAPLVKSYNNRVMILLDSSNAIDALEELLEALGAYDVTISGEEE